MSPANVAGREELRVKGGDNRHLRNTQCAPRVIRRYRGDSEADQGQKPRDNGWQDLPLRTIGSFTKWVPLATAPPYPLREEASRRARFLAKASGFSLFDVKRPMTPHATGHLSPVY